MEITRYQNTGRYGRPPKSDLERLLEQPAVDFRQEGYTDLLNELQANILKHHQKLYAVYSFLHFLNAEQARQWLQKLAGKITTAMQQLEDKDNREDKLNVFLTYKGYEFLEIPDGLIPADNAFRGGLTGRMQFEKNEVESLFNRESEIHAIVVYAQADETDLVKNMKTLTGMAKTGFESVAKEEGSQMAILQNPLPQKYQFKDGISNPRFFPGAFSSTNQSAEDGKKIAMRAERRTDMSPLDLVLEFDKGGNYAHSYGSYGAFSKFEIKTQAVSDLLKAMQAQDLEEDRAIAHILGRFIDGTPLTLSNKPIGLPTNNFDYTELMKTRQVTAVQGDQMASRCPFHTHIRKSNPRTPGSETRRIVRRGMFYKDSEEQKGLLFLSFQRSLEKQFEYILNNWILSDYMNIEESYNSGLLVKTGRDILFSRKGDTYEIPTNWNLEHKPDREKKSITIEKHIIGFKGGLYFFAPSISFFENCEHLAEPQSLANSMTRFSNSPDPDFIPGTEIKLQPDGTEVVDETTNTKFVPGTVITLRTQSDEPQA